MHKKLDLYFYGDTGDYDTLSPSYVSHRPYVPEILYLIAKNEPYSLTLSDLSKALALERIQIKEAVESLLRIEAISEHNHTYKLNFTAFLESDLEAISHFVNYAKHDMVRQIMIHKKEIDEKLSQLTHAKNFSKERWLYHILYDRIFDGLAFDYFDKEKYFKSSKAQPGGRDYLIYGFEDSPKVVAYSNNLLCSSNNFRSGSYVFNSFGDANGQRKDWFRFFKSINKSLANASPQETINLEYIKLNDESNKVMAEGCGKLIDKVSGGVVVYDQLNASEKTLANLLIKFEYIAVCDGALKVMVPIFEIVDKQIVDAISELVLSQVQSVVWDFFSQFERDMTEVTSNRHGVDIKEVAIELWHQLFGFTNELLADKDIVSQPVYIEGEGRYFRSFSREVY